MLVDRERLPQAGAALARIAVLEVTAADSFQGARLLEGHADVAGDGERLGVVVEGALAGRGSGQLGEVRDPAALPGWLATTTQRECGRVMRAAQRQGALGHSLDAQDIPDKQAGMAEHELLMAERNAALREAFTDLPPDCQQLIAMLIQDPPVPHAEISAKLSIPAPSIGPTCGRCLLRLRRYPAIAALIKIGRAHV